MGGKQTLQLQAADADDVSFWVRKIPSAPRPIEDCGARGSQSLARFTEIGDANYRLAARCLTRTGGSTRADSLWNLMEEKTTAAGVELNPFRSPCRVVGREADCVSVKRKHGLKFSYKQHYSIKLHRFTPGHKPGTQIVLGFSVSNGWKADMGITRRADIFNRGFGRASRSQSSRDGSGRISNLRLQRQVRLEAAHRECEGKGTRVFRSINAVEKHGRASRIVIRYLE